MSEPLPGDIARLFGDARARAIYEDGARRQWDIQRVLDWSQLDLELIPKSMRQAMAAVYGDILFSEIFGLCVATRIVELAPEGPLREFAKQQRTDEVRHVDFFRRVVQELGDPVEASNELVLLRDEVTSVDRYDELMLQLQILETAARALFITNATRSLRTLESGVRLPGSAGVAKLMHALIDYVGRDESRHIAFGLHYLRPAFSRLTTSERRGAEERARITARLMYRSFAQRSRTFAQLGLPASDVLDRVWTSLQQQLAKLDLDIGSRAPAVETGS